MTTKNAYPTYQDILDAQAEHSYIRVTGKRNNHMSIAGIYRTFKNPATRDFIYVPSLRLMGSPQDVYNAILHLKVVNPETEQVTQYTPEQAAKYIELGLNKNNYNIENAYVPDAEGGMEDTLIREIEESSQGRKAVKETKEAAKGPPVSLDNLEFIYNHVIGAKGEATSTSKAAPSPSRSTRKTLRERYNALAAGTVLDVSKFNPATKTGATTIEAPGPASAKYGVPGVPVVSNNAATYAAAVNDIFGPEEGARLVQQYNEIAERGAAPRRRRRASPVTQAPAVPPAQPVLPQVSQRPVIPPVASQPVASQPVAPQPARLSPRQNRPTNQPLPTRPALPTLSRAGGLNIPSNRNRPALTSPPAEE